MDEVEQDTTGFTPLYAVAQVKKKQKMCFVYEPKSGFSM
jgi:hypothetical protein